jgi:hypothetical protein
MDLRWAYKSKSKRNLLLAGGATMPYSDLDFSFYLKLGDYGEWSIGFRLPWAFFKIGYGIHLLRTIKPFTGLHFGFMPTYKSGLLYRWVLHFGFFGLTPKVILGQASAEA